MSPSLVPAGMLAGLLDLGQVRGGNHRCCEFMSAAVLARPEDTALAQSSLTSGSFSPPPPPPPFGMFHELQCGGMCYLWLSTP